MRVCGCTLDVLVGPTVVAKIAEVDANAEEVDAAAVDDPNKISPAMIGGGYDGAAVVAVLDCCCCVSPLPPVPANPSPVDALAPTAVLVDACCNNDPIFSACKILCAASHASFAWSV